MSTRVALAGLFALATFSIAAGCVSFSDPHDADESPTPECTPPTANAVDITLLVADAFAYADKPFAAQFVAGTMVLSCTTSLVPAGGDFEVLLNGSSPFLGAPTIELVLSSDADAAHTSGDFMQRFDLDTDGTLTPDAPCSFHETWDHAFSLAGAASESITWELGAACPGTL